MVEIIIGMGLFVIVYLIACVFIVFADLIYSMWIGAEIFGKKDFIICNYQFVLWAMPVMAITLYLYLFYRLYLWFTCMNKKCKILDI